MKLALQHFAQILTNFVARSGTVHFNCLIILPAAFEKIILSASPLIKFLKAAETCPVLRSPDTIKDFKFCIQTDFLRECADSAVNEKPKKSIT